MPAPLAVNVSTPNKVVEFDTVNDAVLSFEAVGTIVSGSIYFSTSTDGVTFTPQSYFSFVSSTLKPNLSTASGFVAEDRGSLDLVNKVKTRITSSPDFQGNVNLHLCEVPDAPEPKPQTCCPQPTVFKSLAIKEGQQIVWTPTPGSSWVLMSYMVGVTGDASANVSPIHIKLTDGGFDMGQEHLVSVPGVVNQPIGEPLYISPWITLGDGQKSISPGNALQLVVNTPLTSGQVYIVLAGREEL